MNHSTSGFRPTAMNIETSSRISTERAWPRAFHRPQATSTPSAAKNPKTNGFDRAQRRTRLSHADIRVPLLDQQLEVVLGRLLRVLSPAGRLFRILLGLIGFIRRLVRRTRSLPSLTSRLIRLAGGDCGFVGGVVGLVG